MKKARVSEQKLQQLLELANDATPRPWYVRELDDQYASSMVAISTMRDTGKNQHWARFRPSNSSRDACAEP